MAFEYTFNADDSQVGVFFKVATQNHVSAMFLPSSSRTSPTTFTCPLYYGENVIKTRLSFSNTNVDHRIVVHRAKSVCEFLEHEGDDLGADSLTRGGSGNCDATKQQLCELMPIVKWRLQYLDAARVCDDDAITIELQSAKLLVADSAHEDWTFGIEEELCCAKVNRPGYDDVVYGPVAESDLNGHFPHFRVMVSLPFFFTLSSHSLVTD